MLYLEHNLTQIRERIELARQKAGSTDRPLTLVAVTKNVPADVVEEAIRLGITDIGENRVQEAERKFPQIQQSGQTHLIGTLQRNKVGKALELFDLIHSVDRIRLVQEISRRAGERTIDILLQVNVSGEETKHGVSPSELERLAEAASATGNLAVRGLMTMAPFSTDPETGRPYFAELRKMGEKLRDFGLPRVTGEFLSMGMSNDYAVAIEEGATHVRIGSAIFAS